MYRLLVLGCITVLVVACSKKKIEPTALSRHVGKDSAFRQAQHYPDTKEIPILCYHNFTENKNTNITVSSGRFEEQVKSLADSGYRSILPDELYAHLTTGRSLPGKPIMLSFDDTRKAQYTIAKPILHRYGFTGTFFIMTVCVDKRDYLSSANLKECKREGNCIASHTYDHPLVGQIKDKQWSKELEEPKHFLEKVTGHVVDYFAYPYGAWTNKSIEKLKQYGYKAAFQLSEEQSYRDPIFTIRRLMVSGKWTAKDLHTHIAKTFHNTIEVTKPKYAGLHA